MDLKSLDSEFEKCLGKYSDSYETGLDVWTQHLSLLNKNKIITHDQDLDSKQARDRQYLMGGNAEDPVYDDPSKVIPQVKMAEYQFPGDEK